MSSPRSTSTSPHSAVSPGGIAATQLQHAQTQLTDDSTAFLSNDMLRLQLNKQQEASRDQVYPGTNIDNEHQNASQGTHASSPPDSASPSCFQSASPLSSLAENYVSFPNANSHFGQNNVRVTLTYR